MFHMSVKNKYHPYILIYQIFKSSNIGTGISLKTPTWGLIAFDYYVHFIHNLKPFSENKYK